MRRFPTLAFLACLTAAWSAPWGQSGEPSFSERYALAEDRDAVLKELIPGSHEYYHYHVLHYQTTGKLAEAQAMLEKWGALGSVPAAYHSFLSRQKLLAYGSHPEEVLEYLRLEMGLALGHAPPQADLTKDLSTSLDPSLHDPKRWIDHVLSDPNLGEITDQGLLYLLERDLPIDRLRVVLSRLKRVDVSNLVPAIAKELKQKDSPSWGAYEIHQHLTLAQRQELVAALPSLLENDAFVRQYLARMLPGDDVASDDLEAQRMQLQRLEEFTERLPPSQNSLKGLVLYQRLVLDRKADRWDRARFEKYLRLPRQQGYYNQDYLKQTENTPRLELNVNYVNETKLPPIQNDSDLIRAYLEHFLQADDNIDRFAQWLDRGFLQQVLIETKILYGIGDSGSWYAQLSPESQKALRDRIELRFSASSKSTYLPNEDVRLEVDLKNVSKLIVRVYQLNPQNIYRKQGKQVSADIDLDGLVANAESTLEYTLPADRRHREVIEVPQCKGRGAWIVDLLGGGLRSRALITKGRLRSTQVLTDAGHEFRIYDEGGNPVPTATIELGTRTFRPLEDGSLLIPYGESDTTVPILLVDGPSATVEMLHHRSERYRLEMGLVVDPQNLLSGAQGALIIRPQLLCNDQPTTIASLEEPMLTIATTDQDGTLSTFSVPSLKLLDNVDATHAFLVPQRLRTLQVTLTGKVHALSRKVKEPISVTQTVQLNEQSATNLLTDFYLIQDSEGYRLQVRGRNGESVARLPVTIQLTLDCVRTSVSSLLATSAEGEIKLGKLQGVTAVEVSAAGMSSRTFGLRNALTQWPRRHSVVSGEAFEFPWTSSNHLTVPNATDWTLLETRSGIVVADWNRKVSLRSGRLRVEGLEPGTYFLTNHRSGAVTEIHSVQGVLKDGFILGRAHSVERSATTPASVGAVEIRDGKLKIQFQAITPVTRVHLVATPFVPDAQLSSRVAVSGFGMVRQPFQASQSFYIDSLKLDEEYQYILQRQYVTKFPGNLLVQPSLLLNPWDTAATENAKRWAEGGEMAPPTASEPMAADYKAGADPSSTGVPTRTGTCSYEFLATAAILADNRVPGEGGWLEYPLEGLKGYHTITAIVVDGTGTTAAEIPLPATEITRSDLRLAKAFPQDRHLTQVQKVLTLDPESKVDLGDARSTRIQVYGTLSDVFRLFRTMKPSEELEKFLVMTHWPNLSDDEKSRVYSELACHELHLFLFLKDRPFFDRVVAPYLHDKYAPQLMDRYLLGAEMQRDVDLWQRNRLNALERILLAQRVPQTQSGTRKWMADALETHPIAPEVRAQLFQVGIAAASLDLTRPESRLEVLRSLATLSERDLTQQRYGVPADAMANGRPSVALGMSGAMDAAPSLGKDFELRLDGKAAEYFGVQMDAPGSPPGGLGGFGGGSGGMGGPGGTDAAGRFALGGSVNSDLGAVGKVEVETLARKVRGRRSGVVNSSMYSRLDSTKEFAETQYYRTRIQQQGLALVPPSPLWHQLANRNGLDQFRSPDFHLANHTLTELLTVLAVIDLPFENAKVSVSVENGRLIVASTTPSIVFVESIEEAAPADGASSVMIGQDTYLVAPGAHEDPEKPVTGQSLVRGVGYRESVVITNPGSIARTVSIMTQIPQGSLPLEGGKFVTSHTVRLEPYSTQRISYSYYFPESGEFDHYGAQASIENRHAASIPSAKIQVLQTPVDMNKDTWGYVSLWGTSEQVLDFLKNRNTQRIDLSLIAFRMQDKAFYEACLAELEGQSVFHPVLWAYSVLHNDQPRIAQLIAFRDDWVSRLGPIFESKLVVIQDTERYDYEHLDYRPLVNPREHVLGARREILNDRFAVQYARLLNRLSYKSGLSDAERMAIVYYLLLQNRIDEAIPLFTKIQPESLPFRVQYDYMDAYLDFYRERYERATEISERYANYGVARWRDLFAQIRLQVEQRNAMLAGREVPDADTQLSNVTDPIQRMLLDQRGAEQTKYASEAPALDLNVDDGHILINYQNLKDVEVRYYLMDIELLFSRNPFVQQDANALLSIQPNRVEVVALGETRGKKELKLPNDLTNRNVLVEVTSGALSQSKVVVANSMVLTLADSFGRLQVTSELGKPVPKAYVKVYAKHRDGQVRFYKDGYTDLRGQFDYVSLSNNELDTVERFAILVLDPERGAVIREASPPKR